MKITITAQAAKSGTLRIWLSKIPQSSNSVYAFRLDDHGKITDQVAHATIYGAGTGSRARERTMLLFRFPPQVGIAPPHAGEELGLYLDAPDGKGYMDANFDIVSVE